MIVFIPERNGAGHITRCINLISWLEKENPNIKSRCAVISEYNTHFEFLCKNVSVKYIGVKKTEDISGAIFPDTKIAVLDRLFNVNTQKLCDSISKKIKKFFIHDEFFEVDINADAIICGMPFAIKKAECSGIRLRGEKFFIINPELEKFRNKEVKNNKKTIGFHFGGYDVSGIYNVISPYIEELALSYKDQLKIYLFSGADIELNKFLTDKFKNSSSIKVIGWIDSVHEILSECNVIVGCGGNLLYESSFCGYAPVLINHNSRQNNLSEWFSLKTGCVNLGQKKDVTKEIFIKTLNNCLNDEKWQRETGIKGKELINFSGRSEIIKLFSDVV